MNIRRCFLLVALALVCCTATAQCRHRVVHHRAPAKVVVIKEDVSLKKRHDMALDYLRKNKYLSVKEYAKDYGIEEKGCKS